MRMGHDPKRQNLKEAQWEITYRNTPGDFFRFYLCNAYSQWTGIVNVIFTVSAAALIFARFNHTNLLGKILMIFALLVFPVIQPLAFYLRGVKQAAAIEPETTLIFTEKGMHIRVKSHVQDLTWKQFQPPVRRLKLTVVSPDGIHAYLIPDRAVPGDPAELVRFIQDHLKSYS